MRKALNENPMVQIGVLAIGVLAFALILMTSMGGGSDSSDSSDSSDPAVVAPESTSSSVGSSSTSEIPGAPQPGESGTVEPPASVPDGVSPQATTPSAPPSAGGSDSADGMLPSKGLPQDVLVAYAKGDAIALLVSNPSSLSDPRMKAAVRRLENRGDVTTFTVEADEIAKYSRITSGVSLSRVPALIVIRPRKLTDNVPTATVSYGFRGPESVEQAVDDALYEGKQRAAYP